MVNSRLKSSLKPRRSSTLENGTAREHLLIAAKKLFARKGLSGTTIRDIAQEAKVNSSQISYYFDSKEGLYRACIEHIAKSRISFIEQLLSPPESKEEYRVRLRIFVENLFSYFLQDRDVGLILIREYDRIHSPAEKVFRTYFTRIFASMVRFFNVAMENKWTIKSGDSLILTSLFLGSVVSELRLDHIKNSLFKRSLVDREERRRVTTQIAELFY